MKTELEKKIFKLVIGGVKEDLLIANQLYASLEKQGKISLLKEFVIIHSLSKGYDDTEDKLSHNDLLGLTDFLLTKYKHLHDIHEELIGIKIIFNSTAENENGVDIPKTRRSAIKIALGRY